MNITTRRLTYSTKGFTDIVDITEDVQRELSSAGFREGQLTIFAVGSTAAVTIIEFEPGLVQTDIPAVLERIAPYKHDWAHHGTWGDDNGAAHVRASLIGGSYSVPFENGKMILGTWQQLIYIDFDTRAREREVVVQLMGV